MCTYRSQSFELLPDAGRREPRQPGTNAAYRRAAPEDTILWFAPLSRGAQHAWRADQSQAYSTADVRDGCHGDIPQATDNHAGHNSQNLPVFVARIEDRSSEPSMERRYHVHPDAFGLHVPGGGHRLVQPFCVVLAAVEHAGRQFLPGSDRSSSAVRSTGDFQQRSGSSVHESHDDQPMGVMGRGDLDGRTRPVLGQRVYRAAVVEREVRIDLPPRICHVVLARSWATQLLRILLS